MKNNIFSITKLMIAFFLCAMGIVLTINVKLGLAPWDVFHSGVSKVINITMGQANIAVGIVVIIINMILGEKLGWATLLNVVAVGIFIDILMFNNLIPLFEGLALRIIMMIFGLILIGFGTYLYLSVGWGAGPRDGLMVAVSKKTKKPVGLIRSSIELIALTIGYILGGTVGGGTIVTAFLIGPIIQIIFRIFKFDVNKIEHKFIGQNVKL